MIWFCFFREFFETLGSEVRIYMLSYLYCELSEAASSFSGYRRLAFCSIKSCRSEHVLAKCLAEIDTTIESFDRNTWMNFRRLVVSYRRKPTYCKTNSAPKKWQFFELEWKSKIPSTQKWRKAWWPKQFTRQGNAIKATVLTLNSISQNKEGQQDGPH